MLRFRKAATRDVVVMELVMPPDFRVPAHDHSPPHVLVLLAGSLSERHGNTRETCAPRSIRYSPGGDAHTDIVIGGEGAHCLVIEAKAFPELRLASREYIDAREAALEVNALEQCLFESAISSPARVENHSLRLFGLIRERFRPTRSTHHRWVAPLGSFLDLPVNRVSPLADAAALVSRNPSLVARQFRAWNGVPVQRYYRRTQIDRVWNALVNSDDPLTAIAATCGFTDQSHMTRAFQRDTGLTPSLLRERVRSGVPEAAHWYRSISLSSASATVA